MAAFRGFPGGTMVKNVPADAADTRDAHLIPGSARSGKKEMTTHSSVLSWRIPGMGEPSRLPSMGLRRVGYD